MSKNLTMILALSITLVLAHNIALADDKKTDPSNPVRLEKIVVSPDKIKEPLSMSANSVSVITRADIDAKKSDFVKNMLTEYNSIAVSSTGAFGGQTSIRIRGANPNHTFLLIDGVKVYDPASVDGAPDFANLSFDNVAQIEITRGPQSTLYGSDAMGGVISMDSIKPYKPFFETGMESGSFYTLNEYVNIGGYERNLHYSFAFSQFNTQGISTADDRTIPNIQETDPYVRKSFASRLDYEILDDLTVGGTLREIDARFSYDNSNMMTGALQDHDQLIGKTDLLLYSVYVEHKPLDCYDYSVRYAYMNNFRRDFDYPAGMSDWYEGTTNRLDFQNNFHILDFDICSVGYDYLKEISDSYYADFATGTSDQPKVYSTTSALYLQNKAFYKDLMGTTQSMRVDHHSQFGTHVTYKIDGFYLAPTGTRPRGSWSTSFKAPSLFQLHAPANPAWLFLGGNPNLQPEKAFSYEFGFDQFMFNKQLRFGVTYFQTRFSNLIRYNTDPATFLSTYQNSAKAKSLGMEYEVEASFLNDRAKVRVGYTTLDTKDYSTDNEILRDPKNQAHVNIYLKPLPKFIINGNINYNGPQLNLGTDKMKEYTVVDLTMEYEVTKNLSIYSKIDNLLNKHYQQVRGYGMPGIGAYGGVKAKF